MNIDRNLIINRFKKMDELLKNLEEIKKYSEKEFQSNFLLYLSAQNLK